MIYLIVYEKVREGDTIRPNRAMRSQLPKPEYTVETAEPSVYWQGERGKSNLFDSQVITLAGVQIPELNSAFFDIGVTTRISLESIKEAIAGITG